MDLATNPPITAPRRSATIVVQDLSLGDDLSTVLRGVVPCVVRERDPCQDLVTVYRETGATLMVIGPEVADHPEGGAAAIVSLAASEPGARLLVLQNGTIGGYVADLISTRCDFAQMPASDDEIRLRVRRLLSADLAVHAAFDVDGDVVSYEALQALDALAGYGDDSDEHHRRRVGEMAAAIAEALGRPAAYVSALRCAAPLHDIGKSAVSRRILLKPEALSPAERENMMRHVEIGARLLEHASSPMLRLAAEVARWHHERWDGRGYLARAVGRETPLPGRIVGLADTFDALTHDRPFRPAWDLDRAIAHIRQESGKAYDPEVVDAFLNLDPQQLI